MRPARTLHVCIGSADVGQLFETNGLWSFQYSPSWLDGPAAYALSPHLPLQADPLIDGGSIRHVQWYFDNLLPEETQRALLARDARLDSADAFGLLAYYGAESAGSLTLLSEPSLFTGETQYAQLTDEQLSKRIRNLPKLPLTHGAAKRMSLAGAQHKLAVNLDDDGLLHEPVGATASSHIIKPDHDDRSAFPHSAINEYFVMRLANRIGLIVPQVVRRYVPEPVYIVERFDRQLIGARLWQRRHAIDACQITGLDRTYKYSEGSLQQLATIARYCRSAASARKRLFQWLVFNIVVGNSDAHLKNLSFLVSGQGIELAPHYDLLSTAVYRTPAYGGKSWPGNDTLAWPVLDKAHFADMNRNLLLEASSFIGLQKSTAARILKTLTDQINSVAHGLNDEIVAENRKLTQKNPELDATLAGEERCLRAIIHNVMLPMMQQL